MKSRRTFYYLDVKLLCLIGDVNNDVKTENKLLFCSLYLSDNFFTLHGDVKTYFDR